MVNKMKLHVNIPKYRRNQVKTHKGVRRDLRETHVDMKRGEGKLKEVWVEKKRNVTYAEAVKGEVQQEKWKGTPIEIKMLILPWMVKSVVGQLKEGMSVDQVGEELVKEGLHKLRARSLGDNLILLTPREGEHARDIIRDNKDWFDSFFLSIKPWMVSCVADHKLTWVRCYGLPLPFWKEECYTKVLGKSVTLVSVDTSSLLWEKLEYVRLQVRCRYNYNPRTVKSMHINEQRCNILIEEEVPVNYGIMNMDNEFGFGSSDSGSNSNTYVEETVFSTKSGEEEIQLIYREVVRSKREEEEGEMVEGGEKSRQKTTKLFGESYPNLLSCQKSGCRSFTNEVSIGQRVAHGANLDCNPIQSREYSSNGYVVSDELAKLVIEVECYTPVREKMGHVRKLEAQHHVDRIALLAQTKVNGLETGSLQKVCEGKEGNEDGSDLNTNGEKKEESYNESEGSDTGTPMMMCASTTLNGVNDRGQERGEEITLPLDLAEGATVGGITTTPPRRRKLKGLFELGDSISFPRRSVRLLSRHAKANSSSCGRDGMCSNSISDGRIVNCNLRSAGPSLTAEPSNLWDIGKKYGLKCRGDEEEVVNEYLCLEERDTEVMKNFEEGDKNDHIC